MHSALRRHVVGLLSVVFLSVALIASEMHPGIVKPFRIHGTVEKVDATGHRTRLANDSQVSESDSIETGLDASVVAVFQNGCAFELGPGTRLGVEQFEMKPVIPSLFKQDIESNMRLKMKGGFLAGEVRSVARTARCELVTPHGNIRFFDDSAFTIVLQDPSESGTAHPLLRINVIQGNVHFTSGGSEQDIQSGYALLLTERSKPAGPDTPALTPQVIELDAATADSLRQALRATFGGR